MATRPPAKAMPPAAFSQLAALQTDAIIGCFVEDKPFPNFAHHLLVFIRAAHGPAPPIHSSFWNTIDLCLSG